MLVTCPQCHASYHIEEHLNAMLVCHRCNTEFTADTTQQTPSTPAAPNKPRPQRKKSSLLPWLTMVLLIIAAAGFQAYQNTWLQQPWLRHILASLHYPLNAQASDWHITQHDGLRQWITRQDGSKVLVLSGYIRNTLPIPRPLPKLEVRFFDVSSAASIQRMTVNITQTPDIPRIHHAPYIPPENDRTPVAAHAKRAFTLVLEHVPEHSREVSIQVFLPLQ